MKLTPSTEQDIEILKRWSEQDIDLTHCRIDPAWWLTGAEGSLLSFCLQDEDGPVAYVRLDKKRPDGLIRLHTQFAPREEVAKLRLAKGMLKCVPVVQDFCKQQGGSGIIFQSSSPLLIDFMKRKFGFQSAGSNDYVLLFQVST